MSMSARVLAGSVSQRVALAGALWLAIGLGLVAVTFWWRVSQVGAPTEFYPSFLLPALLFAVASFLLRALRWHLFVRQAGGAPSLITSLRTQIVGFSLTMTPGKVGELYKCHLMELRTGVPAARTAPIVLFEKLMDAAAFAGLALIAAALLPGLGEWISSAARGLLAAIAIGIVVGTVARTVRPTNVAGLLLPLARRNRLGAKVAKAVELALEGSSDVLRGRVVATNVALSFVARTCDGIALTFCAWALAIQVPILGGIFTLNFSGTLGGLSMLPGGIGIVEGSMALILHGVFGASDSAALAATMLARLFTFWMWVAMGLVLLVRTGLVGEPEGRG